jgi:hypothetical protein
MARKSQVLAAMTVAAGLLLGASGSQAAEQTVVRVGMTPFFDYQFFSVAKEYGWDKQLGLDLQFQWLTQSGPSIQALTNGSLDTVNTCVVCNYPFYESVPEMQNFLTVNQFKGFVVIGRVGQSKSYDELLAELGDAAKAKQAAIEQMKGKTFPVYLANYQPLMTAVLEQAGLGLEDVQTINFADDEKAALAFIGGKGEFYMGGLPSEINLLMNHPDQVKLIGGAEILGPAGLWYSNASPPKVAENEDTASRSAMSYRPLRPGKDRRDHAHRRQGDERPLGRRDRCRQSEVQLRQVPRIPHLQAGCGYDLQRQLAPLLGELGEVLRRQVDRAAEGRRLCGQEPAERLFRRSCRQGRTARRVDTLGRQARPVRAEPCG